MVTMLLAGCKTILETGTPVGATSRLNQQPNNWLEGTPNADSIKNGGDYVRMVAPISGTGSHPLSTPYKFNRSLVATVKLEDIVAVRFRDTKNELLGAPVTIERIAKHIKLVVAFANKTAEPPLSKFETEWLQALCVGELLRWGTRRSNGMGTVFEGNYDEWGGYKRAEYDVKRFPEYFGKAQVLRDVSLWHSGVSSIFSGPKPGIIDPSSVGLSHLHKLICSELGLKSWVQDAAVTDFAAHNVSGRYGPGDSRPNNGKGIPAEGIRPVIGDNFLYSFWTPMNVIEFSDGSLGFACPGLTRELFWTFGNGNVSAEPRRRMQPEVNLPKCQWELERFFGMVFPADRSKALKPVTHVCGDKQDRLSKLTSVSLDQWFQTSTPRMRMDRELITKALAIEHSLRDAK